MLSMCFDRTGFADMSVLLCLRIWHLLLVACYAVQRGVVQNIQLLCQHLLYVMWCIICFITCRYDLVLTLDNSIREEILNQLGPEHTPFYEHKVGVGACSATMMEP